VGGGGEHGRWTLVAVCATTFMLLVDITIVNVALPSVQRELHASLAGLQWVVDAYAVSLAALILTAGALADRYGRRLVFSAGVVLFTAASLLCGVAWNVVRWMPRGLYRSSPSTFKTSTAIRHWEPVFASCRSPRSSFSCRC
jgi:MFS family permease